MFSTAAPHDLGAPLEREYSTNKLLEHLQQTPRYRTLSLETLDQVCALEIALTCEWPCMAVLMLATYLCNTCLDPSHPTLYHTVGFDRNGQERSLHVHGRLAPQHLSVNAEHEV